MVRRGRLILIFVEGERSDGPIWASEPPEPCRRACPEEPQPTHGSPKATNGNLRCIIFSPRDLRRAQRRNNPGCKKKSAASPAALNYASAFAKLFARYLTRRVEDKTIKIGH